jgi:energy-coupling factor transporter ATP-binding protein EcfA2
MSIKLLKKISDLKEGFTAIAIVKGGEYDNYLACISAVAERGTPSKIQLKKGEFIPLLNKDGISRVFMAGPTKSGKSTLLNKMLDHVAKKRPIYLFSRLDHDESIKETGRNLIRVNCYGLLDTDLDIKELIDGVVVIDDADTFADKTIDKKMLRLNNQILETGRHYITAVIKTSHFLMNNVSTRQNLLESNFIIVFVRGGLMYQFLNFLKTRLGFKGEKSDQIVNYAKEARWVGFYTDAPLTLMTETIIEVFQ